MSKLIVLLVVVAVSVQGLPFQSDDLAAAAQSGNWEEFRRLLSEKVGLNNNWPAPLSGDIRSLRGGPDTHVYGHSVSTYKSSSTINGQRTDYSAGHALTNNDGEIAEYDFKP